MKRGTVVRFLDVAKADAFYEDRHNIIGKTAVVEDCRQVGDGYYYGHFTIKQWWGSGDRQHTFCFARVKLAPVEAISIMWRIRNALRKWVYALGERL